MEYVLNLEVEKTNILNNLKAIAESTKHATSEIVVTDFKINYSSFANKRLNSALQSMVNLYKEGYIEYHQLNMYLNLHHRVRDTYAQLIQIQMYRVVNQNDFRSLPLARNAQILLEQAQHELARLV